MLAEGKHFGPIIQKLRGCALPGFEFVSNNSTGMYNILIKLRKFCICCLQIYCPCSRKAGPRVFEGFEIHICNGHEKHELPCSTFSSVKK